MEGVANLGDLLFVVPSLEVVAEDGSIPLTLENQGALFRELQKDLVVAKITDLPTKDAERLDDANQPSGEGESPSAWRIWQIPVQVASVNAVGARHGSEWTSR